MLYFQNIREWRQNIQEQKYNFHLVLALIAKTITNLRIEIAQPWVIRNANSIQIFKEIINQSDNETTVKSYYDLFNFSHLKILHWAASTMNWKLKPLFAVL